MACRDRADPQRPPLHPISLGFAVRNVSLLLAFMHIDTSTPAAQWDRVAWVLNILAEDPNWRGRPSILDELRGQVAPPGRPRRRRLDQSPKSAKLYRRQGMQRQAGLSNVA